MGAPGEEAVPYSSTAVNKRTPTTPPSQLFGIVAFPNHRAFTSGAASGVVGVLQRLPPLHQALPAKSLGLVCSLVHYSEGNLKMSSPSHTQPLASGQQLPIRQFLVLLFIAMLAMSAGIWLDLVRPIWLGPPLFVYMPLVYVLLPLVWLPVLIFSSLWRRVGTWRVLALLVVFGILANCFWFTLTAPRTTPELPYLGSNGELRCRYELLSQMQRQYICDFSFQSSDIEHVTYVFETLEGLPLMRLVRMQYTKR
jgi:hypothetical protein